MMNVIIIVAIVLIAVFAIRQSVSHFRGEGGCCGGGGGSTVELDKSLSGPVVQEKTFHVEGMSCDNCRIRVKNALNRIDGISAEVNLKKKLATVRYEKEVPDEELIEIVQEAGYVLKA